MNRKNRCLSRPTRNGEIGQSLVLMAALLVGLLSMAALVIDLGNVYFSYRELQASSDAAALAGAQDLPASTATTDAQTYSAKAGQKNAQFNLQSVTETATLECLTTTNVPCLPPTNMNAIQVTETAVVHTFFAKLFGVNTITIAATATASAKSGNYGPFNVMMVLDTTSSMNSVDSGCTLQAPNNTRIGCAVAGLRTLVGDLSPCAATLSLCGAAAPVDEVGLEVFPGLTSGTVADDSNCSGTPPTDVKYNASPVYQIIPLSSNYRNSDTSGLNTGSAMAKSIGGGVSGCAPLTVVGNQQTFYADAITQAQATLVANARANTTNVIVLLSDGAANTGSAPTTPVNETMNQCKEAVTAAHNAANAGTWVYAIAYGSQLTGCTTDTAPYNNPCYTMQQIASSPGNVPDATKFFSDLQAQGADQSCVSNARPIVNLNLIFAAIAGDFTNARLIPNKTQ